MTEIPSYINDIKTNYFGDPPIKESFTWVIPEWTTEALGKDSIKVKGIALTSDIVSRNNRQYLDEELKLAARTLSGKRFDVNHNEKTIIGHVVHAEYENGAIEYIAHIKKEPYTTMIRNRDPNIKGVSVQAGYTHNRCSKCQEKFFSEKAWRLHMKENHGIIDGIEEVHGIVFDALSLVVSPEEKGVPTATIELMETQRNTEMMRLFETALKEHGYATETETEKEDDTPKCEAGQIFNPVSQKCESVETVYKNIDEILQVCKRKEVKPLIEQILSFADASVKELQEKLNQKEVPIIDETTQYNIKTALDRVAETLNQIGKIFDFTAKTNANKTEETLSLMKRVDAINELQKNSDTKLKEITEQTTKETVKQLQETESLTKRLEAIETRQDNIEYKFKGSLKQRHQTVIPEQSVTDENLPYK